MLKFVTKTEVRAKSEQPPVLPPYISFFEEEEKEDEALRDCLQRHREQGRRLPYKLTLPVVWHTDSHYGPAMLEFSKPKSPWRVFSPDVTVESKCTRPRILPWPGGRCLHFNRGRFVVLVPNTFDGHFDNFSTRVILCRYQMQYAIEQQTEDTEQRRKMDKFLDNLNRNDVEERGTRQQEFQKSPRLEELQTILFECERSLIDAGHLLWSPYATAEWIGRACDRKVNGYRFPEMTLFCERFIAMLNNESPLFFKRLFSAEDTRPRLVPLTDPITREEMLCGDCHNEVSQYDVFTLDAYYNCYEEKAYHKKCAMAPTNEHAQPWPDDHFVKKNREASTALLTLIWIYFFVRTKHSSVEEKMFFVAFFNCFHQQWPEAQVPPQLSTCHQDFSHGILENMEDYRKRQLLLQAYAHAQCKGFAIAIDQE